MTLKEIEKVIDDEPNYPGPMPIYLWFRTLFWLFTKPAYIFRHNTLVMKMVLKRRFKEKFNN